MVRGDKNLLTLVMRNLIDNAVKYTGRETVAEIQIGSRENEQDLVVFVKDNGAGFDMKYADKLFRVFQRLHRSDEFEGVGIGLANVRRIINRHGGDTWAEGIIGVGATFSFSLPRRRVNEPQ
jgi:light-regulated signal transduction histidine kinase (bacteriophytochrome)